MKLNNDNIKETIDNAKALLAKEKNISPALRSVIKLLFIFMQAMLERFSINSKNSSKPPSSDSNRKKSTARNKSNKKAGGQPGRIGKQLKPVMDPDKIEVLEIDKRTLPKDSYREDGFESRQVVDLLEAMVHVMLPHSLNMYNDQYSMGRRRKQVLCTCHNSS